MANGEQEVAIRRAAWARWSPAKASAVVREAEQSGQNLTDFCRERGLNYERVRRWRIRLNMAPKKKPAVPRFVPVQVVDVPLCDATPKPDSKVHGVLEFDVAGCVVRMRGEVNESMLVLALRAAKEAARC